MKTACISIFILLCYEANAQLYSKYWLSYDDTNFLTYRDSLSCWGINESYYSEWINASSISITKTQAAELSLIPGLRVEKAGLLYFLGVQRPNQTELSFALEQIRADAVADYGLTGKGVRIGIIDGGFLDAPANQSLQHIFSENRVMAYKDFITPDMAPYEGKTTLDDQHGTDVWTMLGGFHPEKEIRYGLATDAAYYLARTDHGGGEKRIEEEYFVRALEWLNNQGVRLVNTSLGYTNGYDKPSENYTPEQMNGSSAIARATQYAIENKGMIIVGAAGNEGDLPWKVVNTPADAKGVIAVGASKNSILDKMSYSSVGPLFLDYVKPELTCFSASGTSFAAPVITGLVACMLEMKPNLSNEEIRSILIRSASLYPYANNYLGYGHPDAKKIVDFLSAGKPMQSDVKPVYITDKKNLINKILGTSGQHFRFRPQGESVIVYHKYDGWKVLEKQLFVPEKKWFKVFRYANATTTTIIFGDSICEVFWQ